jgi:DNA-binding NtrC family response regulator
VVTEAVTTVLVVDDEAAMREVLELRLVEWGYRVALAGSAAEADRVVTEARPDLVVSDVVLPEVSGLELLRRLKAGDPHRPVVLITAYGGVDEAVEAMKLGAQDFLTKPLDYDKLRATLDAATAELARRETAARLASVLDRGAGLGPLVGTSRAMREVYELVERVAPSDASLIVLGESGTGKELVARAVHDLSLRRAGPFVALNAAAVPEGLFESELFGHERGAFTGAVAARAGCFELAHGGTLFFDEITEMPVALQPKVLRVLEDGRVRRLGGRDEFAFDVRVVAASNRDLDGAVAGGRLRHDLYYRLAVFTVVLPPLRERGEDVSLLTQHFVRQFNRKHGAEVEGASPATFALFEDYRWPGNVRELRNVVERAVILARAGWIEPTHLPPFLQRPTAGAAGAVIIPAGATAAEAERLVVLATLERAGGNKAEAARRLGIDVKTIRNKLRAWQHDEDES